MPLQNRVLPTGDIVATDSRGTLTGNRGIIHRDDKTLGVSRWTHHAWICCTLDWQDRRRQVMSGRNWTELFFLDEAVAMAAGHRPCGYCRREAYQQFKQAWTDHSGKRPKAPQMDKVLHAARIDKGTRKQQRHYALLDHLPIGAMIMYDGRPHLVSDSMLHPFGAAGYEPALPRPKGKSINVLTPQPMIAVLRMGYAPHIHPSAGLPADTATAIV